MVAWEMLEVARCVMNNINVYLVVGIAGTLADLQKFVYLPWPAALVSLLDAGNPSRKNFLAMLRSPFMINGAGSERRGRSEMIHSIYNTA